MRIVKMRSLSWALLVSWSLAGAVDPLGAAALDRGDGNGAKMPEAVAVAANPPVGVAPRDLGVGSGCPKTYNCGDSCRATLTAARCEVLFSVETWIPFTDTVLIFSCVACGCLYSVNTGGIVVSRFMAVNDCGTSSRKLDLF